MITAHKIRAGSIIGHRTVTSKQRDHEIASDGRSSTISANMNSTKAAAPVMYNHAIAHIILGPSQSPPEDHRA
jgi:hypothetical protein